ncbi:MAG: transglutaminase domain-containing protein [Clostridiales bacterium]|nr:transglutaminase domain-containing protein [Clostridiales bacterium]
MKRKHLIPVCIMSAAMLFSACSPNTAPVETSTETTKEVTVETTIETTTESTTEETIPELKPVDHVFDPHVLSDVYLMAYGEDFEDDFYRFCDAVLSGDDKVALDKPEFYNECIETGRTCLPITSEYIFWQDPKEVSNGDGTYRIEYALPHDEYMAEVAKFKGRVEELIENCIHEGDSELEKAIELYSSEAGRLSYDYDAADESKETNRPCNPYHSLMEDTGICQEIAGTYAYLLLQVGIDAVNCGSLNDDNSQAHEWTVVKLGGKYYHCDVTFQLDTAYSLRYFGMTDDERHLEGSWTLDGFNFGNSNKVWHKDIPCEDTRFEELWMCDHYELDNYNNSLDCFTLSNSNSPYAVFTLD